MWFNSIPILFYLFYITQSGVYGGGYGGGKKEDKVLVEVPKKKVYEEPKVYKEPEVWKEEPKVYKEPEVWKEEPKVYKEPEVWKEEPKIWKEEVKVYKKPVVYEEPKKEVWKEEEPEVWKGGKDKEWWKKERKEKWRKKKEERWQKKQLWKQQKKHYHHRKRDTSDAAAAAAGVSFIDEQFHHLTKRDGYGYGNDYGGGGYDKKQAWKEQKKWKKQKKWEDKKYKKKWGKRSSSSLEKRGSSGYGKVPKYDIAESQEYDSDDESGADYDKEILAKEIHQLQEDTQDGYGGIGGGVVKQDQYYEPLETKYGNKEVLVTKGSGSGYGAPKVVEKVVIKKHHQEVKPIVIKEEYVPEIKEYEPKEQVVITEELGGDKYGYEEPKIIKKKVEKVVIKEHIPPPPPPKIYEPEPVIIKEEEYEPEPIVIKEEYKPEYKPEPILIKEEYKPKPVVVESSGYGHKKVIKKIEKEYVKPVVVEEVKEVYPEPEYVPEPVVIKEKPVYKQKEIITTRKTIITTPVCNKLMDGLLESLQPEFSEHMSHYTINRVEPIRLSRWGRIALHDGHLNQFGRICRRDDFQAKSFGKNQYLIEGIIEVPEPKCEFMADAHMYNRLKVRNECIRLAAKDATFKVQMLIDKRRGKVHVAELEPLALNGFHLEDEKGRSQNLKWPFSRVSPWQLEPHKYQFMNMLTHELCDKFREMIHRPEVVQQIISQV